ncbi:hypothetical protein [Fodinibius halophilus]|uniref:Uncharacterized protein n=1 Tax=Fodinibius halophilus TaxID=1736908 RepID=A0A6M1TG51_9BACT|nr:hypothetical protein [Fodinibius halophilus]NGP87620.1 hypothetical protein [Fodinibius halophilus]
MKFFYECLAVFIGLSILLTAGVEWFVDPQIPLQATMLFTVFMSLLLTLLYGWIADVYIYKRQPELEER